MRHSTRAAAALARLPEVDPAVAALALWCSYRDHAAATSTEGETIHLGPEFPLLPISEQTGLIAHHVMHVALRHSARRAGAAERYGPRFRPERYDLACDALVNEALLQGGHALPRPAVRAADLVEMLPTEDRPGNIMAEWDADQLYAALAALRPGPGGEDPVEAYAKAHGFAPDLKASAPETAEASLWAGRIEQAMAAGRRAGSGIGAVMARFGDLPRARVPWEIRLRRLLNKALSETPRQSHRRPARGWLARDALARQTGGRTPVFEPGTIRQGTRPRLVIALDTSSSVRQATLDLFAAEAASMVRRTGAEAHILAFDTEVHARRRLTRPDDIRAMELRKDGGTDYAPMLAEAATLDPSMIIVLTDLDAPTDSPVPRVLWAVPEPPPTPPAFGELLLLSD